MKKRFEWLNSDDILQIILGLLFLVLVILVLVVTIGNCIGDIIKRILELYNGR